MRVRARADRRFAGQDEKQFPLGRVAMKGRAGFARGELAQLEVEGMAAESSGSIALRAERDRKLFARTAISALRGRPFLPRQGVRVDFPLGKRSDVRPRGRAGCLIRRRI